MIGAIITDTAFFDEFHARKIFDRDEQSGRILGCLLPIKDGLQARNIYVCGPPGTGKTVVVRSLLKEKFPRQSVYVNCWNKRTAHKVMEEILRQFGFIVHGRESTSELIKKFQSTVKRPIIVCLDECDRLRNGDILYEVARRACTLVLISSSPHFPLKVDKRIESSLRLEHVEFKPYTEQQMADMLRERIRDGEIGQIEDAALLELAKLAKGDARAAMQILNGALISARSKGSQITADDVRAASCGSVRYQDSNAMCQLNSHQKLLYEILKAKKAAPTGKLYGEYLKRTDDVVTDRTYRHYMQKMIDLGLVKSKGLGRWKRFEIV